MQPGNGNNTIRFLVPRNQKAQEHIANNTVLLTEILVRLPVKSLLSRSRCIRPETASWRVSGNPFVAHLNTLAQPCFLQGVLCSMLPASTSTSRKKSSERFQCRRSLKDGKRGVCLHLVEVYTCPTTQFDVLEMAARDCSEWNVKYRVDLDTVVMAYPAMKSSYVDDPGSLHYYLFDVLGVFGGVEGEEEEDCLVLRVPGKILRFSLGKMTFKEICDFESSRGIEMDGCVRSYRWFDVFHLVQSFSRL
ncbi:unnamed protein product [Linum trigynum]|uniref:Uncharacterized protein n=1 Tax=Linum trigynum TaxID=586398 RepID=A0AAV2EZ76_9ROSI